MSQQKLFTYDPPIRALWWKQPFASLMLHGKIETRKWSTDYRGQVLICASMKEYSANEITEISGEHQHNRILDVLDVDYLFPDNGIAIAVGNLVDCRPMTPQDSDACFVEYVSPWISISKKTGKATEKQLWCHVYDNVREIEPFKIKGCQGWLKLSDDIISKIKYK